MTDHQYGQPAAPDRNREMLGQPGAEADEIDLRALWHAGLAGRFWLLGGALVGALIALFMVLTHDPVFRATGSLFLGDANQGRMLSVGGGAGLLTGLMQESPVKTQMAVIQSRAVVERAVVDYGANTRVWRLHHHVGMGFLAWKLGGERLALYRPRPHALRAVDADVTRGALRGALLLIQFGRQGHYEVRSHRAVLLHGRLGQAAVGPDLRLRLIPDHKGMVPEPGSLYHLVIERPRDAYRALQKGGALTVGEAGSQSSSTLVVNLAYNNVNPYAAQGLLSEIMSVYIAQNRRWATDQASSAYHYLTVQLAKIRTALGTADQRLARYQKRSGVISVTADAQAMITQMARYKEARSALTLKLYSLKQIARTLKAPQAAHVNPFLLGTVDNPLLSRLVEGLAKAQAKASTLRPLYTRLAPQRLAVAAQIRQRKAAIRVLIGNQERATRGQLRSLARVTGRFKTQMQALPQAELRVVALTRSSEVLGKLYMFLLQKQEQAAISKADTMTHNRILDTALVHRLPVSPKASRDVILGLFMGFILGASVVFARFAFTSAFRSEEEIRARFPGLPIYALLPHARELDPRRQTERRFTVMPARSTFAEAMRLLRANLYIAAIPGRDTVWLVTSTTPGDGKSTLAYQTAAALAEDGKKVLLIDADLRKPHAHEVFGVPQEPGLTGVLAERYSWREAVRAVESVGFDLLPAGTVPPNAAELIGRDHLGVALQEMRPHYDMIIIDAPPFPLLGDTLLLSRWVDRVLSVVRVHSTPRRLFQDHAHRLAALNLPLGLVINDLGVGGGYGYGYGYGYGETAVQPGWRRAASRLRRLGKKPPGGKS